MKSSKRNACFKWMGRSAVWFIISLCTLFGLFVLSVSVPKAMVRENLLSSAKYLLESEELFFQLREGDRRTEIHNYADATTLNILYSIDGRNCVEEIILSPFYTNRATLEQPVTELLVERIRLERQADTLYDRYWHGMILILRPLFILFELVQIRWIFFGMLLISLSSLTVMLWKRNQRLTIVFLWLGAFGVQLPVVACCIEYFPVFLITFLISCAMVHWAENRTRILELCVVSGATVAFFDFLTTETLAFVLPLALVYCIWEYKGSLKPVKEELCYLFFAGAGWMGAYIGTYLVKWGLASLSCGQNRFSVALSQLAGRQGNDVINFALDSLCKNAIPTEALQSAGGDVLPQFLSAVVINIRLLLGLSGKISLEQLALALVIAGGVVTAVVYLFRKPGRMGAFPVVLLILGTIPMLRMMVLNNHSIEHCFFVYRSLYGTIFCLGIGVCSLINWEFLRRRKKRGNKGVKKQR